MRDTVARLNGVTKRYGDTFALREISLDIGRGGVLALLGPNGAGKTTSVKLMLGLASPTTGTATLFGGDPRRTANRRRIGAMLQVGKVPETLRVREHIDLFRSYYPSPLPGGRLSIDHDGGTRVVIQLAEDGASGRDAAAAISIVA